MRLVAEQRRFTQLAEHLSVGVDRANRDVIDTAPMGLRLLEYFCLGRAIIVGHPELLYEFRRTRQLLKQAA